MKAPKNKLTPAQVRGLVGEMLSSTIRQLALIDLMTAWVDANNDLGAAAIFSLIDQIEDCHLRQKEIIKEIRKKR